MRIGIIRGDLPGPIQLTDLETVSQYNPTTEQKGQTRYLSRPTVAEIQNSLSNATTGAGAVAQGLDISGSFPLTIDNTNHTLRFRILSTDSFTAVAVANAVYASFATYMAAVQAAFVGQSVRIYQGAGSGTRLAFESTVKGVSSYLEFDTNGNGSTNNASSGLAAGGVIRDMPTAATFITALNPVGGTLDVSTTTINAVGAGTNANALAPIPTSRGVQTAMAEAIAPLFIETDVVVDSFLVGNISQLLNANFNPDSRRVPALTPGAAIAVIKDDGSTTFTATLPVVTSATLNSPGAGDVTIAGTGLGSSEKVATSIKLTGVVSKVLSQAFLVHNGGSVSATAIVIPAALIPGATTVTTSVKVQVRQRMSGTTAVS